MQIALEQFDISAFDSADINLNTPEWMLDRLLLVLEALTNEVDQQESDQNTELKLRSILDCLIHESLKQAAWTKAQLESPVSFAVPKLKDIKIEIVDGLEVVRLRDSIVILAPALDRPEAVGKFLSSLNQLSFGFSAKSWLFDFSLVTHVPAELGAYLLGLRHSLAKGQVGLDLLWLRVDAIQAQMLETIKKNFSLYKKGAFLISN